jgi:hypothetical protein
MFQLAVEYPEPDDADEFGMWTGYRLPNERGAWHPLVARLYEYWLSVAPSGGGRLPGRQHIVPEDIAPLWSRLCLLDVSRTPLRYRYRFCGTELVRSFGREVTGRWLDDAHPQLIANPQSRDRFRFMAMTGHPTWRRGPPLWLRNTHHRTIETCIVPLASNGFAVDKMLGIVVSFDLTSREL